jgi:hypothetical protein
MVRSKVQKYLPKNLVRSRKIKYAQMKIQLHYLKLLDMVKEK